MNKSLWRLRFRDGTIQWCISVSQCIVFKYTYRCNQMSIDSSIISMYCCVLTNELFSLMEIQNIAARKIYGYTHGFIFEKIILLLVVIYTLELLILLSSDISLYHDNFDMIHWYPWSLYCSISIKITCI